MRAYVVQPSNESGAAHLQPDKNEEFVTRKDRELLIIARQIEQVLQVHTVRITLLDANDAGNASTQTCNSFWENSVLGHHWIVVDKNRQINGSSNVLEIGNKMFLSRKEIKR